MYQGKFESKSVAARAAAKSEPQKDLQQEVPVVDEELDLTETLIAPITPEQIPEPEQMDVPEKEVSEMKEAPKKAAAAVVPTPKQTKQKAAGKKKAFQRHTVVFYSVYLAFIGLYLIVLCLGGLIGGSYLHDFASGFLIRYEASQPDARGKEVFEQLFADPDWGAIYDMEESDIALSVYENRETFVAYMESVVQGEKLTYLQTSMGLSEDKKFLVRRGDTNIAAFILSNTAKGAELPNWEVSVVEVYTTNHESVTIHSFPGCTVLVNGTALGEEHVIRTTSTQAEKYLPEGLHGPRTVSYYLDGLMVAPEVTILDEQQQQMELMYDDQQKTYSHEINATSITDEQKEAFENASTVYGKFMITEVNKGTLAKYFTGNSYDSIVKAELTFVQNHSGYEFTPANITEFYAYSDTFCSARVSRTLNVTRGNGTVKQFEINTTYFMEKQNGKWMVVEMTNADVQAGFSQVRIRFMQDGVLLETQMLDAKAEVIYTPDVTVPEGKVLAGWFVQSVNEEGKTVMKLAFQTNEFGEVFLPDGYELEPMTVHARFESEGDK